MPLRRPQNLSRPQLQAPRRKLDWEVPFFGSLDTTTDPSLMSEEDSPNTLNTIFDTVQSVATRKGYNKLLTTTLANPIQGMLPYYKSDGTKQLLYASGNQLFKYNNAGGSTALAGAPATFTPNQQWSLDEMLDNVYG